MLNAIKKFFKRLLTAVLVLALLAGAVYGGIRLFRYLKTRKETREVLYSLTDGEEDIPTWSADTAERFGHYHLSQTELDYVNRLISEGSYINDSNYNQLSDYVSKVKSLEQAIIEREEQRAEEQWAKIRNTLPLYAPANALASMNQMNDEIGTLIENGYFREAETKMGELSELSAASSGKKAGYTVEIEQCDYSMYPDIRLYVNVLNSQTGQSVDDLTKDAFFVTEENWDSGSFENRIVTDALQMKGHAGLNMELAIDTSGSMNTGNRMDGAKVVIWNFIAQAHFSEGDLIKLVPFDSYVGTGGRFSSDGVSLQNEVASYGASGGTALYDAILYGVQNVLQQSGAKCVVAFTDGHDESSRARPDELINTVRTAGVPVYIVRVGDLGGGDSGDDSTLQQIAYASGGMFKVVSDFNEDMSAFYADIYREIKQYYLVEYTDNGVRDLTDTRSINVYVQSGDLGGESGRAVTPADGLFSMCCDILDEE